MPCTSILFQSCVDLLLYRSCLQCDYDYEEITKTLSSIMISQDHDITTHLQ